MNTEIRKTVKRLLIKHGKGLLKQRKRFEAFLRDLAGRHKKEITVMLLSCDEQIPDEISRLKSREIDRLTMERLVNRFSENTGLAEPAARWGVESWIEIFDKSILTDEEDKPAAETKKETAADQQLQKEIRDAVFLTEYEREPVLVDIVRWQKLAGHKDQVIAVSFSPDGSLIASGSRDNTVKLWKATEGTLLKSLKGHDYWAFSVAFDPTGKILASGGNAIQVWDIESGKMAASPPSMNNIIISVAFSPDGNYLAGGCGEGVVKLWDLRKKKLSATLSGHSDSVFSVAFSPDGSQLASASRDNTIKLWSVETAEVERTFEVHSDWVFSVAYSKDGTMIASGSCDDTIRIIRPDNKNSNPDTMSGHQNNIMSVTFSPDGRHIYSGSLDSTIRVWDTRSLLEIDSVHTGEAHVNAIALSPDGAYLAAALNNNMINIYKIIFIPRYALAYYHDFQAEKKRALEKLMVKDEFETTAEFEKRIRQAKMKIELGFQKKFDELLANLEKNILHKMLRNTKEVFLGIDGIGEYNADSETFLITIADMEKAVYIPRKEAKSFKENYKKAKVRAIKRMKSDLQSFEYINIKIFHPKKEIIYNF